IPFRQVWSCSASQSLNAFFERPSSIASSREGPVPSRTGVRSMATVTYLSPFLVCRQACSSTPTTRSPSRRAGSAISRRLPFGQDRVVGRVPRHAEPFGDAGHGQGLDHDADQAPAQPGAGDLGPWLGRGGGVLTPHVRALGAPVPADGDQQDRKSTRLNSSHVKISYAVFCLKKKKKTHHPTHTPTRANPKPAAH